MDVENCGVDDANISLAYGRHLAEGNGFVYNVGGERVEGFTSLLHVLVIAFLYQAASFTGLPLESLLLGLLLALFAVVLARLCRELSETHASWGLLPGGLLIAWCLSGAYYFTWSVLSLMETGLYGGLLLLSSSRCSALPPPGAAAPPPGSACSWRSPGPRRRRSAR